MHFVEVFSIWLKYINAWKRKLQGKQKLLLRNLDTGFSWFACVYKQMLRWFATFQVATTCISCKSPDLNLVETNFMFCLFVKYPLPPGNNPIALKKYYYIIIINSQVLSTKKVGLRDGTNLTNVMFFCIKGVHVKLPRMRTVNMQHGEASTNFLLLYIKNCAISNRSVCQSSVQM